MAWPSGTAVITFTVVVLALHFGQDIFIPLALAMVLSVALIPLAARLQRLGLGRVPSVLIVVAIALALIIGFLLLLAGQALTLAGSLPDYEATLRARLHAISDGSNVLDRAVRTVQRLADELGPQSPAAAQPVVLQQPPGALATLLALAGYLVGPVASLAIGLLFMTYLMLSREDVRDRFLRLAGARDLSRATQALADATDRIGRYLLMQVLVNAIYGGGMAAGLLAIGVPSALLWGLIGFVLRFVPYLGAPLSLVFPLLLAFATSDSFTSPLMVLLLFAVVDGLCTYVLEPAIYGHSTGISPLALLVSSALWTVVWGPIGLLLAPPITACLVTIGRHVPQFEFLAVVFGDSQPLSPALRFYHRLLADDRAAAEGVADETLEEKGVAGVVHDLVLPALIALRDDMARGALSHASVRRIADDLVGMLDEDLDDIAPASSGSAIAVVAVGHPLDAPLARAAALVLADAGLHAVVADAPGRAGVTVWCAGGIASATRLRRLAARGGNTRQVVLLPWARGGVASPQAASLNGQASDLGIAIAHGLETMVQRVREAETAVRDTAQAA